MLTLVVEHNICYYEDICHIVPEGRNSPSESNLAYLWIAAKKKRKQMLNPWVKHSCIRDVNPKNKMGKWLDFK